MLVSFQHLEPHLLNICNSFLLVTPFRVLGFFPTVNAGNACVLDGSVYQNGQTFFPSCKYQCMCHDGQIACVPRCNLDIMLPGPDCPMPRRVHVPGECCEKWVCGLRAEASALGSLAMAGERPDCPCCPSLLTNMEDFNNLHCKI